MVVDYASGSVSTSTSVSEGASGIGEETISRCVPSISIRAKLVPRIVFPTLLSDAMVSPIMNVFWRTARGIRLISYDFPLYKRIFMIFEKERLNGYYGVGVYVLAHTVSSAPFLIAVSIIPGVITYYMAGLQPSVSHFIYFALVLYMLMTLVESLMMLIASIITEFLYGIILGAGVQGMMMLTSGFFQKPNDIPNPVWKYPCHYIAFHKYGAQGFFKNEFFGLTFPNQEGSWPPTISGLMIVKYGYEMEVGYSKWVDLAVLAGMVVVYRFFFFLIHKVKEHLASRRAKNNGRRAPNSNEDPVPTSMSLGTRLYGFASFLFSKITTKRSNDH